MSEKLTRQGVGKAERRHQSEFFIGVCTNMPNQSSQQII